MRRSLLICVLMMTLSLSACGGGGGGSEAEELALTIRGVSGYDVLRGPGCGDSGLWPAGLPV